ncbi:hypothetical protein TCAL_09320 [Tigriopus californicus]|uniref:CUB domain-containing protein n=2 Tax=Tigriopus californicus TaxID=6832 RepID=A0A553PQX7_TIGCA|nr:hypothetical protein TCAL_09320 [Tigriopus californicus]
MADSSPCTAMVCRCNSNVCQLRLDFQSFDIAQPNSDERLAARAVQRTQCLDATFTATSRSGNPPVICGTNSGYHMILEADANCNRLNFDWFENAPRQWRILITQVPCNSPNKAPEGCTQYFTGIMGTVESYNFQGGTHLANQDYLNCVRTELGFCQIEWSHSPLEGDFSISADKPGGSSGDNCSLDYVGILGGFLPGNDPFNNPNNDRFCGSGLMSRTSTITSTISSIQVPFGLRFVTDLGETDDVDDLQGGFKLNYMQIPC